MYISSAYIRNNGNTSTKKKPNPYKNFKTALVPAADPSTDGFSETQSVSFETGTIC